MTIAMDICWYDIGTHTYTKYDCIIFFVCFTLLVSQVKNLMETICVADICQGNPDERFLMLPNVHKDTMKDKSGKVQLHILHTLHMILGLLNISIFMIRSWIILISFYLFLFSCIS